MMKKLLLVLILALAPTSALAASSMTVAGYGPRVGFSIDPDQLVLGGQAVIGEVARHLSFDPSLEFGFGDHLTVISFNADLHYHFELQDTDWSPYAGAGVGIHFIEIDAPLADDTTTEVGGNLVVGVGVPTRSANRFFTEARVGLSNDVPGLKIMAGWLFDSK